VLSTARTTPSQAALEAARRSLHGPLDVDRVVRLADGQSVLPLVARTVAAELAGDAPAPLVEALRAGARQRSAESLALTGTLVEILRALDAHRIEALPFKGPTLALQAYGDLGLRMFADLDLLVRPTRIDTARELILSLGFEPSFRTTPGQRALLRRRGSHETFERGSEAVELHWRFASSLSDFTFDYDRLWSRLTTLELGGRSVPALRHEDLLLVLVLHGTKHAWERLGWICDVGELLRRTPRLDWDVVARESARTGSGRALRLALALAMELLEAPLPEDVRTQVAADSGVRPLLEHVRSRLFLPPRSGAGTFSFHLGTRPRVRDKLGLALASLGAVNQRDLEIVSLPDRALPLYFLTRPARLAGKALLHALRGPRPR
jgi:hypothetical protein